jgi:hypothetical protein
MQNIELPPEVGRRFVKDMKAFHREPNAHQARRNRRAALRRERAFRADARDFANSRVIKKSLPYQKNGTRTFR